MSIFKKLFNIVNREPVVQDKAWSKGMWVMNQDQEPCILWVLGDPCTVHVIDKITGETIKECTVSINDLRQARWGEIPECRRGITKEAGEALGYGA